MMRPFLPPPIETVLVDPDGETAEQRAVRRAYESGYQAGLVEGRGRGLDEGRNAGLAEGLEQALAAAEEQAGRARRDGLSAMNAALDTLLDRRAEDRAGLDRSLREALGAALRTIAPVLAGGTMRSELDAMVAEALTRRGTETVTLRAHPDTLAVLPAATLPEAVALLPDPAMRKDMAEASWQTGGLLFDAAALAEDVLAILAPPPPPSPAEATAARPGPGAEAVPTEPAPAAPTPAPQQQENPA